MFPSGPFSRWVEKERNQARARLRSRSSPYQVKTRTDALATGLSSRRVPGEDLPKVMYSLLEAEGYTGKQILIVGGGDSAVEAAMGLAHQKGNRVTLSYRKDVFSRLKERNDQRIRECMRSGKVQVIFNSQPVDIRERSVILEVQGGKREIPNDFVWVFAGGTPPNAFLAQIGVQMGVQDLSAQAQLERREVA